MQHHARHPVARCEARRASAGVTLIETMLATSMLVILVGGAYTAVSQAGDTWGSVVQKTSIQSKSRDTVRQISEELKQAANITIDKTDKHADLVTFQVPLSITDGTVSWGATYQELSTGELYAKPGFWVQYRVVDRQFKNGSVSRVLIRRVLTTAKVPVGEDRIIARHVDVLRDGKRAFEIVRTGDLYALRLRLIKAHGIATNTTSVDKDFSLLKGASRIELRSTFLTRNWKATSTGATVEITK